MTRSRKKLGQILVAQGVINAEQAAQGTAEAKKTGKRTGEALIEGRVEIVEGLGETMLLHLERVGEAEPTIAKLPGIHSISRHETVRLGADPAKLHLFDVKGRSFHYR